MKPTIAIFIHDPQCETDCALGMIQGFVSDFNVRTFGLDELNVNFLDQHDVVAFPGGMGDSSDFYSIFTAEHILAVQSYVELGGKYFGICMGAYWAGPDYFDLVTDLEIEQYIIQPDADITFDGPICAEVAFDHGLEYMYFYDGCAILGPGIKNVVASYANNDAMAVIQDNVGVFGCHPEALPWWYTSGEIDENLYNPRHAELMNEFVHKLLAK